MPQTTPASPGLVVVFSAGQPAFSVAAVGRDGSLVVGRGQQAGLAVDDDLVSRGHARVVAGESWLFEDLSSRNGTSVNGQPVLWPMRFARPLVARMGGTLVMPVEDTSLFARGLVACSEGVRGPGLIAALDAVRVAGVTSRGFLFQAHAGSDVLAPARAFHATRAMPGPFVDISGGDLPAGVVHEQVRLAVGGTLFLRDIDLLGREAQRELVGSLGRLTSVRCCASTRLDLRAAIGSGQFRDDLLRLIATSTVRLPLLRERREEIPWLVARQLEKLGDGFRVHASFIEACLLRAWPGNERELKAEVRAASARAMASGTLLLDVTHLGRSAGSLLAGHEETQPRPLAALAS